jgi:hypothetical protein
MPGKDLVPRPAVLPPAVTGVPPWAQGKPETVTAWKWLRRRRHWTVPVTMLPVLWLAGLVLHAFREAGPVLVVSLALSAAFAVFAPHKWDRLGERWYAWLSVTLAGLWLWLAAWAGPVRGQVTGLVLAASLAAMMTAWGIPWYAHKRPRGHGRRARRVARWDRWWQSHAFNWHLGGSKVIDVWETGVTTKVRVQGLAGRHSIQHVRQVTHLIESGLDGYADIGMVRPEEVKGKPSQFDLFFKRENPLREIVEYDLALAPRSVHEQAPLGFTETGKWKMASLRANGFTIGAKRTGKSNHLLVRLAALTGCADDRQILVDLKGGRSARPVLAAGAVDYVITEVDEARMVMRMLVAEALGRAKHCYVDEEEQLHATVEVPAIHLMIDEVHGLTSVSNGDTECARLLAEVASKGAGLEEYVEVYTQHGSLEESVRTEQTRGNLDLRTVYRVMEARHGAYVIPEYNKLDASKLDEKGTCYVKDGPEALPEQVRAPHMPHSLLRQIAAQNAQLVSGRPPLQLYCGAETAYVTEAGPVTWQQWWDTRWLRLDPAFHAISPQYQAAVAASPAAAFTVTEQAREAALPQPAAEPGTGNARQAAERIRRELEEAHRGVPAGPPPQVNLGPVIAAQKDAFASALESAPPDGISPTQLRKESGMGESWIYAKLRALVEMGTCTQIGRGRYLPVPGEDIRQALAAIEAGNDQLYREAREKVNAA